jgi:Ca2+-binding RTX toxin-like protein
LDGRGNDVVRSSKGRDTLNGGIDTDRLTDKAGRREDRPFVKGGKDTLNAKDGRRGDLLSGGPRRDKAFNDRGDKVRSI